MKKTPSNSSLRAASCVFEYYAGGGHYVRCVLEDGHEGPHRDGFVHQRVTPHEWFAKLAHPSFVESAIEKAVGDHERFLRLLATWAHVTSPLATSDAWWLVFGRIALHSGRHPYEIDPKGLTAGFGPVVSSAVLTRVFPAFGYTAGVPSQRYPGVGELCAICGRSWTFPDIFDRVEVQKDLRHRRCHAIQQRRAERDTFYGIFGAAGYGNVVMDEIPNQYWPHSPRPWFLVALPEGDLRIGWRKSVISIEWAETNTRKVDFVPLFEDEGNITLSTDTVHAHGSAKAVEYLRRLREHLLGLP